MFTPSPANRNRTDNARGLIRANRLHVPYVRPIEAGMRFHRDGWNAALEWVDRFRMWAIMDRIVKSGLPLEEGWAAWVLSITPSETMVPAFWTFLNDKQIRRLMEPCLSFLAGFVDGLVAYCAARERERKRDRGEPG